jgi:hypothetical protein
MQDHREVAGLSCANFQAGRHSERCGPGKAFKQHVFRIGEKQQALIAVCELLSVAG